MKLYALILACTLFVIVGVPRLFDLDAHWSTDEALWIHWSAIFMIGVQNGEFDQTYVDHHPGIVTLWLGGLRWLLQKHEVEISPNDLALSRWFVCVTVSTGLVIAFFLLRRLFETWIATAAWAFVVVNPFVLAQTRRVHTDALATIFILLTVLLFLLFCVSLKRTEIHQQKRGYLIFSGVAFGFACLSKSYSLILLPWFPVCLWLFRTSNTPRRAFFYNIFTSGILFLNCSMLTVFGVWPVFWHPTTLFLGISLFGSIFLLWRALRISRHIIFSLCIGTFFLIVGSGYALKTILPVFEGITWAVATPHAIDHFFLEKIIADPGWLFYLFTLSIKSTPFTIPLAAAALLFHVKRNDSLISVGENYRPNQDFRIILALGAGVLIFMVFLSFTSKKFSRYLLPVFPMLDVLAGIGLYYTAKWVGARFKKRHLRYISRVVAVTCVFLLTAIPVFALHPYYGSYYNLCWKLTDITKIITINEWAGLEIAAKYLNQKPDAPQLSVQASHLGAEILRYYFLGTVYRADNNLLVEGTSQLRHADYEVVFIRDSQIGRLPQTGTRNGELERTVTLNGIDLVWIYRIVAEKPAHVD